MTKRAVLYARTSYDDRDGDGRNLDGQLEMARQYALSKGYTIIAELAEDDRGASGAAFELPRLNDVRDMAQVGAFDVLIPREIDRLSRNLAKQLIVEEELKRCGVEIEYAVGEYPDTPEGRLNKHIKATIAEYEREKVIERTTRGRRARVKAGIVISSGRSPYGYKLSEEDGRRTFVVFEPEATIVRLVFTWYVNGNEKTGPMALRAIVRKLDDLGIPVPTNGLQPSKSGKWSHAAVRNMLANETYAGRWTYGKRARGGKTNAATNHIHVQVPAIVPRELWLAAQIRLEENLKLSRGHVRHEYLMRGRLRCSRSPHTFHGETQYQGGKTYQYYVCPNELPACAGCPSRRFNVAIVDTAVWEWIKELLTDPEGLQFGLEKYQAQSEHETAPLRQRLAVIDDLIADARRQLERLLDLYLASDFSKEMLTDRKSRLESTLAAMAKERAELLAYMNARILTAEQIQGIKDYAAQIATGLSAAEESFEKRERLIKSLDVQAILAVEDGQKVAHTRCVFGEETLQVDATSTCGSVHDPVNSFVLTGRLRLSGIVQFVDYGRCTLGTGTLAREESTG